MRITRALCAFEWLTAHRARYYAALFTVFGVVAASARNGNAAGPLAGTQQTTPSKPGTGAVQSAGVTSPTVIREVKPRYTLAAQRAKIEGTVGLECIVGKDGTVVDVHVVRSLDPTFGLDDEAVKAARQWLFRPGTRNGEPVPVLIKMELSFHLNNTPSPVPLGAESTQQVQPPAGFPAVGAPPIVALISTGTEPRKALRFVIANGHREHMTIDTTMTMTVTMGDNSMPEMKLPLLRIGVDLEVMAVSNTGDMTILTTFTDASWIPTPGSDPATLTRLNSTAAGLKGPSYLFS